jgi:uncharacterized repeat protein (TIGR01451 family)
MNRRVVRAMLTVLCLAAALAASMPTAAAQSGADLAVTVTADRRSANAGRAVTYTITVANLGDTAATGVELFVGCPDNLQCGQVSAIPATLEAGASATATMSAIANPCGLSLTRSATVQVAVSSTVDPHLSNNSAQVTIRLQKCHQQ